MKHNPFDAIKILNDTRLSIHRRKELAIAKLEDSIEELQQLYDLPLTDPKWTDMTVYGLITHILGENQERGEKQE